jgi:deazaflavin-dependent oxidoreductase (nitroreductase family)
MADRVNPGMGTGPLEGDRGTLAGETVQALGRGALVDLTTTGRRTGEARTIEIAVHVFDGRAYISGMPSPRRRSWLANLEADPRLTLHLRPPVERDVPARARIIATVPERRAILERVARAWQRTDLEVMMAQSPLIEVEFGSKHE